MNGSEYYQQLINAKQCIDQLKLEISYKENQLLFIYTNSEYYHTIDSLLSSFYSRYQKSLSLIKLSDMKPYQNNSKKIFREIEYLMGFFSEKEREVNHGLELIEAVLSEETNPKKYSYYKKKVNEFKKLLYETPLQIVQQCFDCEIYRPESGEIVDEEIMEPIGIESTEIIDDLKELRHKKLGTFVENCAAYGVKDKEGKVILRPLVTISLVELSDRYKNFTIVK